jgi:hypothetical protein
LTLEIERVDRLFEPQQWIPGKGRHVTDGSFQVECRTAVYCKAHLRLEDRQHGFDAL